jgi:hypothetical protein
MAKDNFKATDATKDAGYNNTLGTTAGAGVATGLGEQATGFGAEQGAQGAQMSFAQMLQQQASGQGGPTMADSQIQSGTALNNANAAGFAASQKGLNPALAARQAMMAQAGNNQQSVGQAAATRTQEQLNAQSQEGSALAGAAGTAGAMTGAGTALAGTTGSIANTSNANILNNQESQDKINAGVAAANTSAVNGAISGLVNGAGAAFGMADGGEVPDMEADKWDDEMQPVDRQYAYGGPVSPDRPAAPRQRSFAAQVAHHLKREYFDEGGEAQPQSNPPPPTDAEVAAEGNVEKKKELEARRQKAMDEQALADAAAAPKKAYGGDIGAGDQEQDSSYDADTDPEYESDSEQYFAYGGLAAGHRDAVRRMALGGMVGEGAGRAGSAPSGELVPEMQLDGMKVKYRMPKAGARGGKGKPDYHGHDGNAPGVAERAPALDLAAPVVTGATTARGFRDQLRKASWPEPRAGDPAFADNRPLLDNGGRYRQPVAFAKGGAVSAPQQDRAGGLLPPGHGGITRGPSLALMGAGGGSSHGIGPTAHFANGGVSDPSFDNAQDPRARGVPNAHVPRAPQHFATGGTPATAEQMRNAADPANVGEMPNVDSNGNASPTGQGMTNGEPDGAGFFETLGKHFADRFAASPIGSLIMGSGKPATSSGTPLSPGEQPSQGAPLNSVPKETPDAPANGPDAGNIKSQTGSDAEARQLDESKANDENHAMGGDVWDDHFQRPKHRQFAQGGQLDMGPGGPVPGQAEVPGNSLENDKVPAMLSPGEVVLPRTIAHKPHQAKRFVQHLRKNGGDGAKTLASIKKRKAG